MFVEKLLAKINLSDALIICILSTIIAFFSGSFVVFFIILFLSFVAVSFLAFYHKKLDKLDNKNLNYAAFFFIFIALSAIAVIARNINNINMGLGIILILLNLVLIGGNVALIILFKTMTINISSTWIFKYLPFAIAALLVFLLSLTLFKTVPIFDDWFYYDNLSKEINVHTLNDINALKMCAHMTHFWSISAYIIYCVVGNLFNSIILLNIILLIIALPVTYKAVRLICPKCNHWFAFLCAVVFAFSPFALGFAGYACPHTILGFVTLFFVYSFITKDKFLTFITAAMLMFTFETGIFITAALLFLYILFCLIQAAFSKSFILELKKHGLNVLNISLFLLHVLWLVVFLQENWGGIGYGGTSGGGLDYKFNKALYTNMTLLTNFNWVIFAGIAAAIIKLFVELLTKKITLSSIIKNKAILIFIAAFFISITSFTFITTLNYIRYILTIFACSYFLFFASLHYLFENIKTERLRKGLGYGVLVCLSFILAIQSYVTIDPVMLSIKEKTYMGNGKNYVVNAAYNDYNNQPFGGFIWDFFDAYVYNRQASHFSIAFNKAMSSIDYSTDKCIVVGFDISRQYLLENKYYGLGYSHAESRGFRGWDSAKQQQFISFDKEEAIRYTVRPDADSVQSLLLDDEFSEYWFLDYNSGLSPSINDFAAENNNISIAENHSISYLGWKFTLTKINLKS